MNGILTLVGALLPILLTYLQQLTGLSPNSASLITGIEASVADFLELLDGGQGSTITASSVLVAISSALSLLQAQNPTLAPEVVAPIRAISNAIQAGITANAALTTVDPAALAPITPLS